MRQVTALMHVLTQIKKAKPTNQLRLLKQKKNLIDHSHKKDVDHGACNFNKTTNCLICFHLFCHFAF